MRSQGTYAAAERPPHGGLPVDVVSSLLDGQMEHRLAEALAAARRLLGDPDDAGLDRPPREALAAAIARLVARLGETEGDAGAAQDAHERQIARLHDRYRERADALARAHAAVGRLREITSPPAMLAAAPEELCDSSTLDRVVLSIVREGEMLPTAVCFRDDREGARAALDALRGAPIRLEHPLLDAEVLRRRRATVVADAHLNPRVHAGLVRVMGWGSYVAAPVTVRSRAIAVLHADAGPSHGIDVLHRDVLWEFAVGLGQAYESASLRRTLRREREHMRRFLERLDARLGELSDAAIELSPATAPPGASGTAPPSPPQRDAGAALDGVLTRREIEVLELVSEGLTNRAIADRLVVSEGTVKFHVNGILRKLRVANRAEAVSRYLGMLRTRQGE